MKRKDFSQYKQVFDDIDPVEGISCEKTKEISEKIKNKDQSVTADDMIKFTEHLRTCDKCVSR